MKKVVIVLFIIMLIILLNNKNDDYVIIPSNAIRFRIIANSNNIEDQRLKYKIRNELTPILSNITNNTISYESTDILIKDNINNIKQVLNDKNISYQITYGENYFPEKVYKGVKYPAGEYESLVITLGDGLGDNWWCVLFPPLCLMEANEESLDEYEYSFFIKDIIDQF